MAALADMLMEGSPSGEQAARALACTVKPAAIGYPPAALKAAELLQNGKGGELDADEAYRLLRRAADATGDPRPCICWPRCIIRGAMMRRGIP